MLNELKFHLNPRTPNQSSAALRANHCRCTPTFAIRTTRESSSKRYSAFLSYFPATAASSLKEELEEFIAQVDSLGDLRTIDSMYV
jgi:hypothetical protein